MNVNVAEKKHAGDMYRTRAYSLQSEMRNHQATVKGYCTTVSLGKSVYNFSLLLEYRNDVANSSWGLQLPDSLLLFVNL